MVKHNRQKELLVGFLSEACGWLAMEEKADVQVLRLTMELALVRSEVGRAAQHSHSEVCISSVILSLAHLDEFLEINPS